MRTSTTTPTLTPPTRTTGQGWLGSMGEKSTDNPLHQLPDAMTDPFSSLTARLKATLETYRYSTEPRSLIEWAAKQTGHADPLSHYTRSELEQAFPRFARDREKHMHQLIRQIKQQGKYDQLDLVARETTLPAAREALYKALNY